MTTTTDTTEQTDAKGATGATGTRDAVAGSGTEVPVAAPDGETFGRSDVAGDELEVFDDVVDDRMRARWVEARRAEGRRRLYVICAIVGVLATAAIAYVIAHSSLLGAGTIEVRGVDAVTAPSVRAAARIPDGEPLVFLDEGAVARRVERLPTVARADVSTELPSTVVIRITPRVPVAWMGTRRAATPVAVLDRDGRVIALVAAPPAGLPRVGGVGRAGTVGTQVAKPDVLRALVALPDALRAQVVRVVVRADAGPVLVLGGPAPVVGEVRLGSLAQLRAKATAALAVMDALAAQGRRAQVLGVQVPDAPYTEGSP